MVSTGIAKANFIFATTSGAKSAATDKTSNSSGTSFEEHMSKVEQSSTSNSNKTDSKTNTKDASFNEKINEVVQKAKSNSKANKTDKIDEEDEIPKDCNGEEINWIKISEMFVTFGKMADQMKDQLQEYLGVSKEELNDILNSLGFNDSDLMNENGLKELFAQFTQTGDAMGLLTNQEISDKLSQATDFMNQLKNEFEQEFGLSDKEFNDFINKIENSEIKTMLDETKIDSDEVIKNPAEAENTADGIKNTSEVEGENEISSNEKTTSQETASSSESVNSADVKTSSGNTAKDGSSNAGNGMNNNNASDFTQTMINNIMNAVEDNLTEPEEVNVIRQIIDGVQFQSNKTIDSLEIQLSPEHLGKVNIQVAVKDGVMTASISAETEAAKRAMENQLTLLKDNLNNQGLKIDAVEITVASHGFEQNMNQSNEKNQNEKANHRAISKADLAAINGEVLEDSANEQNIQEDGNTVNYIA